ncbi:MAG TPA: C13 family peptidase [Rhizomicrobium sp.]|nr:C13 family peptidase [Rhizomicrobium sp.]
MKRLLVLLGLMLCAGAGSARAEDFSKWAVLIVAGDDRAQNGKQSQVFDNGRKALAKAFAGMGFAPGSTEQFSLHPDGVARATSFASIANALWDLSGRAPGGCLIYFTSHGTPDGIVVGDAEISPGRIGAMVNNSCGDKPSVIVMSACFSGQFVPVLARDSRIVITAARPDRTSFGCGEMDQYTFFDDCFLRALPLGSDFAGLGDLIKQCVTTREKEVKAEPPSEPQVSIGSKVAFTLRWK